jgi:hypothetical protein
LAFITELSLDRASHLGSTAGLGSTADSGSIAGSEGGSQLAKGVALDISSVCLG